MLEKQIVKLGVVAILLLTYLSSVAQHNLNSNHYPKREIRVSLETILYQKLIETSNDGNSLFKSRDVPSGMLTISNSFRLPNNFSIEPSIGISLISNNYYFKFDLPNNHPLKTNNGFENVAGQDYSFALYTGKIGVFLSKEFYLETDKLFSLSLGVNWNLYPTYALSYGEGYELENAPPDSTFRLFSMHLEDESGSSGYFSNLSYTGKIVLSKYNIKGNSYSVGLIFNFQPSEIGVGSYYFDLGTHKETGTLKWKNSYYGFCFSKSFNRDKKE